VLQPSTALARGGRRILNMDGGHLDDGGWRLCGDPPEPMPLILLA
jgi:hypothetical protein